MYTVYVLQNPQGLLYKGHTDDLEKRIHQRNSNDGFRSYTHGRGPWTLIYKEEYETRKEACDREKFLKSGRGRDYLQEQLGQLSAAADG